MWFLTLFPELIYEYLHKLVLFVCDRYLNSAKKQNEWAPFEKPVKTVKDPERRIRFSEDIQYFEFASKREEDDDDTSASSSDDSPPPSSPNEEQHPDGKGSRAPPRFGFISISKRKMGIVTNNEVDKKKSTTLVPEVREVKKETAPTRNCSPTKIPSLSNLFEDGFRRRRRNALVQRQRSRSPIMSRRSRSRSPGVDHSRIADATADGKRHAVSVGVRDRMFQRRAYQKKEQQQQQQPESHPAAATTASPH